MIRQEFRETPLPALKDIWSARCLLFCLSNDIDPWEFYSAVQNQLAYNGRQSTITTAAAGTGFPNGASTVAGGFKDLNVHAAASITSNDAYFRPGGFLSSLFGNGYITESTIEREALHNMTGMGDTPGVEQMLGLAPNGSDTTGINQALKDNGCSH